MKLFDLKAKFCSNSLLLQFLIGALVVAKSDAANSLSPNPPEVSTTLTVMKETKPFSSSKPLLGTVTVFSNSLWKPYNHNYSKLFSLRTVRAHDLPDENDPPTSINLQTALTAGLKNNLQIKTSRADAQAQTALAVSAAGSFLPDVELYYRDQRRELSQRITPLQTGTAKFNFPIYRGGRIFYSSAAQAFRARAFWLNKNATVNDTLFFIGSAYSDLLQNQAIMSVRAKSLDLSRYWYSVYGTQRRLQLFRTGDAANADLIKMRLREDQFATQMFSDEQELALQALEVKRSALKLASLLSFQTKPGADNTVNLEAADDELSDWKLIDISNVSEIELTHRPQSNSVLKVPNIDYDTKYQLGRLNNWALYTRPELRRSAYFRDASMMEVGSAFSPLLPSIDLYTIAGRENVNLSGPSTYSSGIEIRQRYGGYGVPELGNTARRYFEVRKATFDYNQQFINIVQQVNEAFIGLRSAKLQFAYAKKASTKSVNQVEEILAVGDQLDQPGRPRVIDALNAEREYTSNMTKYIKAVTQLNVSQIQLIRAIGGNPIDGVKPQKRR